VKDESAFPQPHDAAATGPGGPLVVHLPLYRPGTQVVHQGQHQTVSHVIISRGDLTVHLQESGLTVPAEKVQLAPTRLVLQRS
jgi:hypothetical protein